MPHLGRTRSSSQVSTPVRETSITVDEPLRITHRSCPFRPSPIVMSSCMSIQRFCSGARSVEPTMTSPSKTWSWIFATPFTRCSERVRIGRVSVPGIFICMMCVKVVVALSEPGMNIDWVKRHVWPSSRIRSCPPACMPLTSWRWRSVEKSRSTMCMLKRKLLFSTKMCGCPAGWELARSSSTPSKAPTPSWLASGAQRSCQVASACAAPKGIAGRKAALRSATASPRRQRRLGNRGDEGYMIPPVRTVDVHAGGPWMGTGSGLHVQVVEVGSTVGGGGGGADGVGSCVEVGRDGDVGPGVPATGAVEREARRYQGAVDGDVHGPVGGAAVGVAEGQRSRTCRRRVDRPLHVRADHVVVVDEAGAGEAEVVGLDHALRDRGVLRLVPHRLRWLWQDLQVVDVRPTARGGRRGSDRVGTGGQRRGDRDVGPG